MANDSGTPRHQRQHNEAGDAGDAATGQPGNRVAELARVQIRSLATSATPLINAPALTG